MRVGFPKTYHASHPTASAGAGLFALSCYEHGYAGSKTGIDTLFVVAVTDYNEAYRAKDTLNNIVLMNYWTSSTSEFDKFFPLSTFIDENRDHVIGHTFEVKFDAPPTAGIGQYQFKVILKLDNGAVHEHTTGSVELTR